MPARRLSRLYSIAGGHMGEMLTGALLARRHARSEIDRDEYLQKRSDILGYQGMPPRS